MSNKFLVILILGLTGCNAADYQAPVIATSSSASEPVQSIEPTSTKTASPELTPPTSIPVQLTGTKYNPFRPEDLGKMLLIRDEHDQDIGFGYMDLVDIGDYDVSRTVDFIYVDKSNVWNACRSYDVKLSSQTRINIYNAIDKNGNQVVVHNETNEHDFSIKRVTQNVSPTILFYDYYIPRFNPGQSWNDADTSPCQKMAGDWKLKVMQYNYNFNEMFK